jgi:hypothetical protein
MNPSSTVVVVAPLTVALHPATTGFGIVVVVVGEASVESGGADAFELSVDTAMTPVMVNRAVVNFFADMTTPMRGCSSGNQR